VKKQKVKGVNKINLVEPIGPPDAVWKVRVRKWELLLLRHKALLT
jgi:hypothetical protein